MKAGPCKITQDVFQLSKQAYVKSGPCKSTQDVFQLSKQAYMKIRSV